MRINSGNVSRHGIAACRRATQYTQKTCASRSTVAAGRFARPTATATSRRLSLSQVMPAQPAKYSYFCTSSTQLQSTTSEPIAPAKPTHEAVSLDYELHEPPSAPEPNKAGSAKSIVVCHGLFGSKQNWRSLARGMAKRFSVPVYALDLRNHGTSPHVKEGMSYYDMALDLIKFFKDHDLKDVALVGHSMGGKAVMSFALHPDLPKDALQYLVSVDMSPARGPLSKEFTQYIDTMARIQSKGVSSRSEADAILKETEPDLGIRQFLLTNLHRPKSDGPWQFRIPIAYIKDHFTQIGDFPFESSERQWDGRMLFVKGEKSKYLNHKNRSECEAFFPNNEQVVLPTGHWVQAEKPAEFVQVLEDFLLGKDLSSWKK